MAHLNKPDFINLLQSKLESQLGFAHEMIKNNDEVLNTKPSPSSWSILECVEHMNLSMNIYIEQLKILSLSQKDESNIHLSWKGNFFAEGNRPKGNKISYKIKTMKKLKPISNISKNTLSNFTDNITYLYSFITNNKSTSWNNTKISTALGSLVKLNVGEALNFIIAHNERHILQSENVLSALKTS